MNDEHHPLTQVFPPADEASVATLTEQIKREGQKEPIVLYEGKILNGRARAQACAALGIEPQTVQLDAPNEREALRVLVDMNKKERSLNPGQVAVIGLDILLLQSKPPYSEAQIREVSDMIGAAWSSVQRLARIHAKSPKSITKIRRGELGISAASREAGFVEYEAPINRSYDIVFGKGDKFRESTVPLIRYLRGWKTRGYEFRHLSPREAEKRLNKIDQLLEELTAAREDLARRAHRPRLTHSQ